MYVPLLRPMSFSTDQTQAGRAATLAADAVHVQMLPHQLQAIEQEILMLYNATQRFDDVEPAPNERLSVLIHLAKQLSQSNRIRQYLNCPLVANYSDLIAIIERILDALPGDLEPDAAHQIGTNLRLIIQRLRLDLALEAHPPVAPNAWPPPPMPAQ